MLICEKNIKIFCVFIFCSFFCSIIIFIIIVIKPKIVEYCKLCHFPLEYCKYTHQQLLKKIEEGEEEKKEEDKKEDMTYLKMIDDFLIRNNLSF